MSAVTVSPAREHVTAHHQELRSRLRRQQARRQARRGGHGPVVQALHATADLMDAWADAYDRRAWAYHAHGDGLRPRATTTPQWPRLLPAAAVLDEFARIAAWGMAGWNDWPALYLERLRRDGIEATRRWDAACKAVLAELDGLLYPSGLDSPPLTADAVRAIADRVAVGGS